MGQAQDLEFRTQDLALAAYLCVEGHNYLRVEKVEKSQYRNIVFDADENLLSDVEDYQAGAALVEPLTFQKKVHWLRNKMNPSGRKTRRAEGS